MSERERTFGRETSGWLGKTLTHLNEELYNATSGIFIFDFYACIHEHGVERERERGLSMYAWAVEVYVSPRRLLQGT